MGFHWKRCVSGGVVCHVVHGRARERAAMTHSALWHFLQAFWFTAAIVERVCSKKFTADMIGVLIDCEVRIQLSGW